MFNAGNGEVIGQSTERSHYKHPFKLLLVLIEMTSDVDTSILQIEQAYKDHLESALEELDIETI